MSEQLRCAHGNSAPDCAICHPELEDRSDVSESTTPQGIQAVPVSDILREIDHIKQNGMNVSKFGGEMKDEGRCRQLCAMYLDEFVRNEAMSKRLVELFPSEKGTGPSADDTAPDRLIHIEVDGSTHVRTAQQWLDLARADLRGPSAREVAEKMVERAIVHGAETSVIQGMKDYIAATLPPEPAAPEDRPKTGECVGPTSSLLLAAAALHPCRSPYCECELGKCTHPGFYDARHEPTAAAHDDELGKHVVCPDENHRCMFGDDLNCPALGPEEGDKTMTKDEFWQKWIPQNRSPFPPPDDVKREFMDDLDLLLTQSTGPSAREVAKKCAEMCMDEARSFVWNDGAASRAAADRILRYRDTLPTEPAAPTCEHKWVSARNELIDADFCIKCHAIRPLSSPTPKQNTNSPEAIGAPAAAASHNDELEHVELARIAAKAGLEAAKKWCPNLAGDFSAILTHLESAQSATT